MSDANDSQNMSTDDPYIGDAVDLASSESRTESNSILVIEALRVEYPPGRAEGMGESSTQNVSDLLHIRGRSQPYIEKMSHVEKASTSWAGNTPHLYDEEEEGEEDEEEEEEGEGEGEGEGKKTRQEAAETVEVRVASGKKTIKKKKKTTKKEIPPVVGAVNVIVDGAVGTTRSLMTVPMLHTLRIRYNIPEGF